MGWTFCRNWTRKTLIDYLLSPEYNGNTFKVIAHTCTGNNLWVVFERTPEKEKPYRFIALYLMQNGGDGHGWGYKDMDESCGPYFYNCPLSYLELATPTHEISEHGIEWRENVKRYWERKKNAAAMVKGMKQGEEFKSEMSGKTFFFLRDYSRGYILAENADGKLFRVKKDDIILIEEETPVGHA